MTKFNKPLLKLISTNAKTTEVEVTEFVVKDNIKIETVESFLRRGGEIIRFNKSKGIVDDQVLSKAA